MMCRSKTCCLSGGRRTARSLWFGWDGRREGHNVQLAGYKSSEGGFGLMEAIAALVILTFFGSGVLVVINRCMAWAAESALRMQAFEVARENMEKLLASDLVKESSEYGDSEKYPDVKWQTDVETFYEPITSRMWVRGVCSAEYEDAAGELQTIELTHWLTNLSKEQLLEIMKGEEREKALLAGQLIETIEDAAAYAGVAVETIEQWLDNGMASLENGSFVKQNLDLYKNAAGNPTIEEKQTQVTSEAELTTQESAQDVSPEEEMVNKEEWLDRTDPATGLTNRELEDMSVQDLFDLLMQRRK